MFLKLSYLNSYFVLTLGYLNPALNNPAWKDKFCMLICSPPCFFLYSFKLFMIQGQLRAPVSFFGGRDLLFLNFDTTHVKNSPPEKIAASRRMPGCSRDIYFQFNKVCRSVIQKSFNKFFSRHGLIVEKYGAALREMRLAIQA